MSTAQVEVEIPKRDVVWFGKNMEYPVMGSVDREKDTVAIGERVYRLFPAPNGGYHVMRGKAVLGTVEPKGVKNSVSDTARYPLRVIRSLIFGKPYDLPLAIELRVNRVRNFAHPGDCHEKLNADIGDIVTFTKPHYTLKGHRTCDACGGGFE